ncbi:MAG TPA: sulfite exporter TauE/SafE family protein [Stellaceae bacterium]|nr:sulfite exporter TauE/SafE family protein [Stellaceae bacterium]
MSELAVFGAPYITAGLAVGFVVGLTGVGGGSLMTPLLVLFFGISPVNAVGTDLLFAAVTKTCGTAMHHLGGTVEWPVMRLLALGSVPASVITLVALHRFGADSAAVSLPISHVLGYALLLTTVSLLVRRRLLVWARGASFYRWPAAQAGCTVLLGLLLGVLVTLSSVGAGAIGATVLVLLYPDLPIARIVGTDLAHAVPLTLVAGLGHLAIGTVNPLLLGFLLIGSLPGIAAGSLLAPRAPERALSVALAAILLVVGFRLVLR